MWIFGNKKVWWKFDWYFVDFIDCFEIIKLKRVALKCYIDNNYIKLNKFVWNKLIRFE